MPTGYTAKIADGISFNDFALSCARAFGACIEQRDDDPSDKPKTQNPCHYHLDKLEKAHRELANFKKMSNRRLRQKWGNEMRRQAISALGSLQKKEALRKKYAKMLEQVKAWVPPTIDHQGLKEFMEKQITESMDWDCDPKHTIELGLKDLADFPTWKKSVLKSLQWDIDYYAKRGQEDLQRTTERNSWIRDLYQSLGEQPPE